MCFSQENEEFGAYFSRAKQPTLRTDCWPFIRSSINSVCANTEHPKSDISSDGLANPPGEQVFRYDLFFDEELLLLAITIAEHDSHSSFFCNLGNCCARGCQSESAAVSGEGGSGGGGGTGGSKGERFSKAPIPLMRAATSAGRVYRLPGESVVGCSSHPNRWCTVCGACPHSEHMSEVDKPTRCQ